MSTYVIGDIHGCYDDLMRLLDMLELSSDDRVNLLIMTAKSINIMTIKGIALLLTQTVDAFLKVSMKMPDWLHTGSRMEKSFTYDPGE